MVYGNKPVVVGIQNWVPRIGDVQGCFNLCCCTGLSLPESHSQGTQEWCMAFLGSLTWVHCAEGGNSKQKSHEKGKTKKALRAVPASVGAEKRTGGRDPVTV